MSPFALRQLTRTNADLDTTLAGVTDQGEHIMEQSTRPVDEHETEEYKSLLPSPSEMKLMRDSYKASNYHGHAHPGSSALVFGIVPPWLADHPIV